MALSTRREFLYLAAAASVGCAARGKSPLASGSPAPGNPAPVVRAPAVGQSWRYAKHDYITGELIDTQIDRVSQIGPSIEIESRSETAELRPMAFPSWGESWWHTYLPADAAHSGGPIEIHRPWGMVAVDPHWSEMQSFEKAIPIWPAELRPGWSTVVSTRYKIPGSEEAMPWQLSMDARRWESVTVPAGHFMALRCFSFIDFRFSVFSERTAAQRMEHLWFAPEIGRWVKRESMGTFHEQLHTEVKESSFRWELLSWT
jgi:hypothetical protein